MSYTYFCAVRKVLALLCITLLASSCRAIAVEPSEDLSVSVTFGERFLFWENCEDRWNNEKKVTEKCCKGNYKCSSDMCKDNRLCQSGFFGGLLWCHADKCSSKDEGKEEDDDQKDTGNDNDNDKDSEDDGPEPSGEADWTIDADPDDSEDEPPSPSPSAKSSPDAKPSPSTSPAVSPSPSREASPSPPPQQDDNLLHCNGRRNRREMRDMTPEQRRNWRQAIIELRADRDENGDSEWDRLVRLHMTFNDEAHGGSYFLPWHRLFLLRLENALRKKRPNLALPYWDWSRDADDAALSQVWDGGFAGGARRGNRPIQSGPFQNMDARHPFGHVVRRDFTSGTSGEIAPLWRMGSLNQLINDASWADFTDGVEAAHALPHIYIGGDMVDAHQAPNDPIFYLHHAFVDYLYALRQRRRGQNQFGGTHDFRDGTRPASADRVLRAFGVPTRRAFDLGCVHYVSPSTEGRNIVGRGGRPADEDVCGNDVFTTGETLNRERCRRGEEVLAGTQ